MSATEWIHVQTIERHLILAQQLHPRWVLVFLTPKPSSVAHLRPVIFAISPVKNLRYMEDLLELLLRKLTSAWMPYHAIISYMVVALVLDLQLPLIT